MSHTVDTEKREVAHYEEHEDGPRKNVTDENEEYVVDPTKERALVRKIDRHLLPMLWVMYIFNYIDRTNIGNAKVGGMQKELNLSSSDYSLILSIFFVSYLLFEVPSNMILVRSKPAIFLPAIMFIWGAVSIGVKGIDSLGGMVAFRIALGIIEAGFFPGVMLLMSCWYKPAELSKRIAMFYTASLMSGAFGGLLAGAIIEGMEGTAGVQGWKWLFMIEGLATCVTACAAFFILPNFPTTTRWLSEEEKELAVGRLAQRSETEGEHVSHRRAFLEALKDPKTYTFMLAYNLLNSVGTISYFFPTLMNALGHKGRSAQFMTVPIYCVALVISLALGVSADKTGKKAFHVIGACCLSVLSFVICVAVQNPKVKYAFICFGGAGVWSAVPLFLSWMVTMFDGREKRAICIALINGVGNLASVYGSFFWPASDGPKYIKGFAVCTALMGASALVMVFNKWRFGDKGVQAARR